MKNLKIQKNLTYEEIGSAMDISAQQVHKKEIQGLNKIFQVLCDTTNYTPVEIIIGMSEMFGADPGQIYKKLDENNVPVLLKFVQEQYATKIPGFEDDLDSIEDLFG